MPQFHYYTRTGCHLCELMLEELLPLIRGRAEIELRDIDSRSEWLANYDIRVPVIEFDGRLVSGYPLNRDAVGAVLARIPEDGE